MVSQHAVEQQHLKVISAKNATSQGGDADAGSAEFDLDALQAQIDLSMSLTEELVSSWLRPSSSSASAGPSRSGANKMLDKELQDYLRRPARLGVGAPIPESSGIASRETERLKQKLSNKRKRDTDGLEADGTAHADTIANDDDQESRGRTAGNAEGVTKKKARFDPFAPGGGKAGNKKKKFEDSSIRRANGVQDDIEKSDDKALDAPDESPRDGNPSPNEGREPAQRVVEGAVVARAGARENTPPTSKLPEPAKSTNNLASTPVPTVDIVATILGTPIPNTSTNGTGTAPNQPISPESERPQSPSAAKKKKKKKKRRKSEAVDAENRDNVAAGASSSSNRDEKVLETQADSAHSRVPNPELISAEPDEEDAEGDVEDEWTGFGDSIDGDLGFDVGTSVQAEKEGEVLVSNRPSTPTNHDRQTQGAWPSLFNLGSPLTPLPPLLSTSMPVSPSSFERQNGALFVGSPPPPEHKALSSRSDEGDESVSGQPNGSVVGSPPKKRRRRRKKGNSAGTTQ